MNNIDEYIKNMQQKKLGLVSIMKEYDITVEDIRNTIYGSKTKITDINLEYFRLYNYNIVVGDFITGVQYEKNNKKYYMMISANSFYANPQQMAVGTIDQDNIHMICESFPNNYCIELISFPKEAINKRIVGFVPKSYRKTINLFKPDEILINEELKKCLECGLEASNTFCELISQVEEKRKKLSL